MHYDGTAFAVGNTYTILDKRTGKPVQRNNEISQQDYELLNKIYPGDEPKSKVLVLNSRSNVWQTDSHFEWNQVLLIDSTRNGQHDHLACYENDYGTEARGSCAINWKNQMIIFGGESAKRQISRLENSRLNQIGNLKFDHEDGACTIMNNNIFLCFNWLSSKVFISMLLRSKNKICLSSVLSITLTYQLALIKR